MARIIGGVWKRTPLNVIEADDLRPTPDRVKETLFNWLGDVTNWIGIDLFAGSGALGLELLSRGGENSILISLETNKKALTNLFTFQKKLEISSDNWVILNLSAFDAFHSLPLKQSFKSFKVITQNKNEGESKNINSIIFCDPPFRFMTEELKKNKELQKLLKLYQQLLTFTQSNYFYWELPKKNAQDLILLIEKSNPEYQLYKQLNAGEVCATLWKKI